MTDGLSDCILLAWFVAFVVNMHDTELAISLHVSCGCRAVQTNSAERHH